MTKSVILDTGPLVAFLYRRDRDHLWAKQQFAAASTFITCEPVLTEAAYLVRDLKGGAKALMALVKDGIVQPVFRLADEQDSVAKLLEKYADVPMSLADACLVRMAELHDDTTVCSLDRNDFSIYRKNGTKEIPLLAPARSSTR